MTCCYIGHSASARLDPKRPMPPDPEDSDHINHKPLGGITMTWTTPTFEDLRLGFEINLYVNNR